jgi:hypothetical protein
MHISISKCLAVGSMAAATIVGCSRYDATPTDVAEIVSIPVMATAADAVHLTGDQERPTPVDTRAVGQFVMKIAADGQSIEYRLIASNIQNVTQAHIHRAAPGAPTGGVVVWLYPSAPPAVLIPGRHSGVLATGTITAANLVGSLAGQPLSALIAEIEAGNTYANVHTSANAPGEIRGDIR